MAEKRKEEEEHKQMQSFCSWVTEFCVSRKRNKEYSFFAGMH